MEEQTEKQIENKVERQSGNQYENQVERQSGDQYENQPESQAAEQTGKRRSRRYVRTDGRNDGRGRGGFGPGLIAGLLVGILGTIAVTGIFMALRGGSSTIATGLPSSISGGAAVDDAAVNKLKLLEQYIDSYYYKADEVAKEDLQNGMYKGLMDSLGDVYSCYFTPQEYQSLMQQTEGVYYGIGAYVSKDVETGACVISGVIRDTPAEAAGLMEGDIIYSVEGKEMNGLELEEVVSYIKGDEGTKVKVTIIRNGEPIEMELTRAKVTTPTVDSEMKENGIGYLQITEFDDVTTAQFEENMASLKEQGMKGLIIDLRSNPGGNVTTVCEIAEKILPKGMIFYMEDKNGQRTEYTCEGADFDLPLVVLVNEYSASAAEILSGAVKDAGIGKLVGKKTFGKGIVQTVAALEDGSAIKLTIANYYTRNGNDIHLKGIEPDVEIEMDAEKYLEDRTDTQLEKGIEVLTELMSEQK